MKPSDDIENKIKNLRLHTTPAADERILTAAGAALEQSMASPPGTRLADVNIWRTIMKSHWPKLATAAAALIAVLIGTQFFFNKNNIAIAQVLENMKNQSWTHMIMRSIEGGANRSVAELWLGFDPPVDARIGADGRITYADINKETVYIYDPDLQTLHIVSNRDRPSDIHEIITGPDAMLDALSERLMNQGARMLRRLGSYRGKKAEVIEFTVEHEDPPITANTIVYIDPQRYLIIGIEYTETDDRNNVSYFSDESYEYPPTGPADIYDLGVPPSVKILDQVSLQQNFSQRRNAFPDHYFALCFTESQGSLYQYELTVYCQKGALSRSDTYILPETFDPNIEITYEAISQLVQNKRYHLWKSYIDDGQIKHNLLHWPGRDPIYQQLTSESESLMVRAGWGADDELSPFIIENEYRRENNLICLANTNRPDLVEQKVHMYYDPARDYLRVKMTVRQPDMDMDWDWTDFAQTPDGHWYPIREEQHIKSPQDDIHTVRLYFLNTNPQFPDDIFDPDKLPKK